MNEKQTVNFEKSLDVRRRGHLATRNDITTA